MKNICVNGILFLSKKTNGKERSSNLIKNIVFDMGGVFLDLDITRTLNEYFPEEYSALIRAEVFESELWREIDRGTLRFDEALPLMLEKLPSEVHELITEMVTDFYPYMKPFDDMLEFVKEVKRAGYKTYLLSNASPRVFDHYLDIPQLPLMDGLFISALYKVIKPEKEIFERFCEKFGVKPEECFFIDDTACNIAAAKEFGMDGYVYKAHDIEGLRNALANAGVKFKEENQ